MSIAAFIILFLLRFDQPLNQDGRDMLDAVRDGLWYNTRSVLPSVLNQSVYQIISTTMGGDAMLAIGLVSCIFGALFAGAMTVLLRDIGRSPLWMTPLFCCGFALVFYGHIEYYATAFAMIPIWMLAVERSLARDQKYWLAGLIFSLGGFAHLGFLFLWPVGLAVIGGALALRNNPFRVIVRSFAQYIVGTLPIWIFVVCSKLHIIPRSGAFVGDRLVPLIDNGDKLFALFSLAHIEIKLWFLMGMAGAGWVLLPFLIRRLRRGGDYFDWLCAGSGAALGAFFIFWHPDLAKGDWDLFSFPAVPLMIGGLRALILANINLRLNVMILLGICVFNFIGYFFTGFYNW